MSSATALAVPAGVPRRIEKLAKEAGRTPAQMLNFVIGDGLEQTEYAVREADAGLAELDAGKGIPLGQARRRAEARATVLPRTVELSPRAERQFA